MHLQRIATYRALYALGLLLTVVIAVSTYASIAFIDLLQLNSTVSQRVPWLDRF